MTNRPTPEEIRRATFRVVFRGFDQDEVVSHLARLATVVEELTRERERLASRLGEFADRDLKTEFEIVGREVTAVLEAARSAADTMRERATADATRWRGEAMAEVDRLRKEARADAESMRTDAWTTGTQLLEQVQAEVERQRASNQRDSLAVMGEAEREAHRLTAIARREADDLLRTAKMDSERMVAQARTEHDDMIANAHRQAEAAQERARALEERRAELMAELESVRSALSSVETELEERRQGIGLSEPPELPRRRLIVDADGTEIEDWEEGRTVRVIHPNRPEDDDERPDPAEPGAASDDTADADRMADEVARLHDEEAVEDPPGAGAGGLPEIPDVTSNEEPATEPEAVPEEAAEEATEKTDERPDEVFALFRRLRQPSADEPAPNTVEPEPVVDEGAIPQPEPAPVPSGLRFPDGIDPFETRERLLLPITNAALRAIKRTLTEAQNEALEQIRVTEGDWAPDAGALESAFREDFESLTDQASQAGVEAAVEMGLTGLGSLEPQPAPDNDAAGDLAEAISTALQGAGSGSRERQAAASRVFRGWRTDEAERRVRGLAFASYHGALRQALESRERTWQWVPSGRLCPTCREAAERGDAVPPAHRDCNCIIVPV